MTSIADQICGEINQLRERRRSLDEVLARAVELVHEASPRFHWSGIYELFPDNILRLGPFIGAAFDEGAEEMVEAVADCLADAYVEFQTRRSEPAGTRGSIAR